MLFKDEVRQLGRELGLPEYLVMRQPFPGPGLGIRVIGALTKEKLDMLREADFIFRDEMHKAKLDKKAQQFFAIMTNVRSVGVKNGARTSSLNSRRRGSMISLKSTQSGRPPTLWWLLMTAATLVPDSITSG